MLKTLLKEISEENCTANKVTFKVEHTLAKAEALWKKDLAVLPASTLAKLSCEFAFLLKSEKAGVFDRFVSLLSPSFYLIHLCLRNSQLNG